MQQNIEMVLCECSRNKSPQDRYTILTMLAHLGIMVPPFGKVEELYKSQDKADWCVVWLPGESRMMTLSDAYNKWATNLAVMHVGQRGEVSVSTRYLQIGDTAFWIDYTNIGDWRSSRGKSEITRIISQQYHQFFNLPVFAIDYVKSNSIAVRYNAIGFDAFPGIRGTGIDQVMSPKEITKLIGKAITHFEKGHNEC